ncbi:hypothetical protein ACH4ZX_38030 [Streptomyces sp. NPDC020490]|uniref:hypothetical protein n=1 Tax=Streptomyces sp. NPDC020490 TaxID=3365078 RepID=UPI00379001A3
MQRVRAYGTMAQIHISQAAAHLATGEVAGALALPPDHRLAPVTRHLNELSAGISRPHATDTFVKRPVW